MEAHCQKIGRCQDAINVGAEVLIRKSQDDLHYGTGTDYRMVGNDLYFGRNLVSRRESGDGK
jgi:hypothetical protein